MNVNAARPGDRPDSARVWEEDLVIPTYRAGRPLPYPLFLERRVYQGSSGRVYPYPVIDRVADRAADEVHRVVWLENEYLRVMVMPGFGGRIQSAYDKTNGYPFVYHNRVIKPALVGLAGPWLSGGIEFNWPQHHRPGTYCPVPYRRATNPDGSVTLWIGETEPMWHLRGVLAMTLHPGRAVLSITAYLSNPTPLPRTFHLWTNPAVHVNDDYQSVFPPDVQAVYDHGKRAVSSFPMARGHYYKVDYTRGVDISRYRNLPVPTSYMAARSRYDFLGGYDHGRGAGVLHVADHHVVPGKKQWVWGCGEFGRAWDRELTDEDGPYAELMCGVFADNQPDFTWLEPYERKVVTQSFLPYKAIGYVRNATVDAAVSFDVAGARVRVGAYATSPRRGASVRLAHRGRTIWRRVVDLGPDSPFIVDAVPLPPGVAAANVRLEVADASGDVLVAYTPEPAQPATLPDPARAIPSPRDVPTTTGLELAAVHLEQYRHATRQPDDYLHEALRRDPDDLSAHAALGRRLLDRGSFEEAERHLRAAIRSATRHNANPRSGEPHYLQGLVCRARGDDGGAEESFAKAAWDPRLQDAACLALAQIAATRGDAASALRRVEDAIVHNRHHAVAQHLRAVLLRRLGRHDESAQQTDALLAADPLDPAGLAERVLLARAAGGDEARAEHDWLALTNRDAGVHLDVAARYAACGASGDAMSLLVRLLAAPDPLAVRAPGHDGPAGAPNLRPLVHYAIAHYAERAGLASQARRARAAGSRLSREACFPNSLDHQAVLESALAANPDDATAAYLLGLLWYDRRDVERARVAWERSRRLEPSVAATHRNLSILAYNKDRNPARALRLMRRAFALSPGDARFLFELDLLEKRCGVAPASRLRRLRRLRGLVEQRDDLSIEYVSLLNGEGRHADALEVLGSRRFHPWEGGEGRAPAERRVALGRLARQALASGRPGEAIALLEQSRAYPSNLGEGRLHGTLENETLYWLGVAHDRAGDRAGARSCWREAAHGMDAPAPALYYNDQDPATIAYQGFALRALGRDADARRRFASLVNFGSEHLCDQPEIDFFAVSLPEFQVFDDDLARRHETNCRYLRALGHLGLGRRRSARRELERVLHLDPAHRAARLVLRWGP